MSIIEGDSTLTIALSTDLIPRLSIIFTRTSEPQGMDQEGDLQHCRMWQVLQRSHHRPVCSWDLGRGAHTWETRCPWWQALICPHDGRHASLYHNTNALRTYVVDTVRLVKALTSLRPQHQMLPASQHCVSHNLLDWLSLRFSYLRIHNIQVTVWCNKTVSYSYCQGCRNGYLQ